MHLMHLPWDTTQAQTVANFYLAFEQELAIVPVLNKIDMDSAEPAVRGSRRVGDCVEPVQEMGDTRRHDMGWMPRAVACVAIECARCPLPALPAAPNNNREWRSSSRTRST